MKLITTPLEVGPDDGFKNDLFDRKEFGESLLNLITQSDDELVISLDAQWGSGKTTFIKMWQGLLNNNDIPNIYIDAFANDYIDDPFMTVAGAINNYINENYENEKDKELSKEKIKKVGSQVLSLVGRSALKLVTGGMIGDSLVDGAKKIKNEFTGNTELSSEDVIDTKLNDYLERTKTIEEFKKMLSEITAKVEKESQETDEEQIKDVPLVIIIDELDRCKPSYAVEMLEKIKHLFSTKNVFFLLAIHKTQLEIAIRNIYGQDVNADVYLQKFINIETILPYEMKDRLGVSSEYAQNAEYINRLVVGNNLEVWDPNYWIVQYTSVLVTHFKFSFRQIERVVTNITFIYKTIKKETFRQEALMAFLVVIKVAKPEIFNKIKNKDVLFDEIVQECKFNNFTTDNKIKNIDDDKDLKRVVQSVKAYIMPDDDFDALPEISPIKYIGNIFTSNVSREWLVSFYVDKLLMFKINEG